MNVLITSAGRRVSLVQIFQKELEKLNPEAKVMTTDANPDLSAACQVSHKSFSVPRLNKEDYILILLKICKENDISLIIPTIDLELLLLAENEELLHQNGINVVISSIPFIKICRDKRKTHKFFLEKTIEVAREYDKDNYQLPLFIKPFDGSRSVDTYIIHEEKDLKKNFFKNNRFLFLEYLDDENYDEYTCDLYYSKNGTLKCAVPRKRIEVRDGEVNKGLTERNELVPYIQNKLGMIKGARGCLTAQFFKHKTKDRIIGIEINARFGGGFPLSYLAGANYAKWIIEEYMNKNEIDDQFNSWEEQLLMLRYDDEILVHGYKG